MRFLPFVWHSHLVLIAEYLETITREVNGECRFTEHSPWLCCLTSESSYLVGCCIKTYGTLHRKDLQGDSAPRVLEWVRTFRLGRRSFCCVLYLVIETSERLGRHQIKTLLWFGISGQHLHVQLLENNAWKRFFSPRLSVYEYTAVSCSNSDTGAACACQTRQSGFIFLRWADRCFISNYPKIQS